MDIKDRTVIVTGAGSGVGRALALAFGRAGAQVVCAARREDRVRETVSLIEGAGGRALAVRADVTDREQVEHMVSRTMEQFGQIDLLFNNAGSFQAIGPVWEVDPSVWWTDVTVNLLGTMLCCRAVLPGMMARGQGIILNMSGGSRIPGGTGYSSSKVAVVRFTELLAEELKREGSAVLAFVMGPGFVRTEMTQRQIESPAGRKWMPGSEASVREGRDRPPGDCARATMELLRIASPALSGRTFGAGTDFAAVRRELETRP